MELLVKAEISEEAINQAMLKNIESLERDNVMLNNLLVEQRDLIRDIVATNFTQLVFGGRAGMTREELYKALATKTAKEIKDEYDNRKK